MDNACQPKMTEAVCISGYIHDVSPVKTSKRNNKYFNAVCQNGRDEYHDIVVFTADKHGTFTSAAGNKTAIKMNNVKRELKNQDYVIMCNRQTTIDVTNLTFEYRKNKTKTQLTIAQLKEMDSHQMIPRLSAHVCHVNTCTEIIQNNNNDCEIKKCEIADHTATIQLVLWESYMDKVLNKTSYNFTDLATRMYNGEKYLTTTRYTTVTALDTPIANTIAPNTATQETSLLEMTSTIEGAKINLMKQCPKCHATQKDFQPKDHYHRCLSCKFLRRSSTYITKCNGVLTLQTTHGELDLTIGNSLLNTFLTQKQDIANMDSQDMEEQLISCGAVLVTYTDDLHITSIQEASICTQSTNIQPCPVSSTPEKQTETQEMTTPPPLTTTPKKRSKPQETATSAVLCTTPTKLTRSENLASSPTLTTSPNKQVKDEEMEKSTPMTSDDDIAIDDLSLLFKD